MANASVNIGESEHIGPGIDVLRASLGGTFTVDDTKLLASWSEGLKGEVIRLTKEHGHKICILIDISKLEIYTDAKVIDILTELMKADKGLVHKTATFGGNDNHVMVQQIISGMAERNNLRNFSTEKEAVDWLRSS
jgi:hypothetical protein